jgi:hypothetical protein
MKSFDGIKTCLRASYRRALSPERYWIRRRVSALPVFRTRFHARHEIGVLSLAASDSVCAGPNQEEANRSSGTDFGTKQAFIACRGREVKPSQLDATGVRGTRTGVKSKLNRRSPEKTAIPR